MNGKFSLYARLISRLFSYKTIHAAGVGFLSAFFIRYFKPLLEAFLSYLWPQEQLEWYMKYHQTRKTFWLSVMEQRHANVMAQSTDVTLLHRIKTWNLMHLGKLQWKPESFKQLGWRSGALSRFKGEQLWPFATALRATHFKGPWWNFQRWSQKLGWRSLRKNWFNREIRPRKKS